MPNFVLMKTSHIVIVAALILAVGIAAWYISSKPASPLTKQPTGQSKDKSASVSAIVVKARPFSESITLTGSVSANESVELRAEVAGRITKIGFVEGRQVRAGQLLVKLNDSELVARRLKIRQQAALDLSRKIRLEKLRAVDGTSLDEFEAAVSQVEMRAAELSEIDAQIAQTEIRAPFTGVVGLRNVSVGAVITPQTILTSLTSTGVLNIDCSVPERFASSMRTGSDLSFRVRGTSTSVRRARIIAIEPVVDVRTRTQRIRARIEQPQGVTAGMFADVTLTLSESPNAILIPTAAVVQDMKGANVFRIESGIARSVLVKLGSRTASEVLVEDGLRSGDTLVVSGVLFVKNGTPVKVTIQ